MGILKDRKRTRSTDLHLFFHKSFFHERFEIGAFYAIHHRIELFPLFLGRFRANLLVKGYSILSETAATHFARNQSVTVTSLEKNLMRFGKKRWYLLLQRKLIEKFLQFLRLCSTQAILR